MEEQEQIKTEPIIETEEIHEVIVFTEDDENIIKTKFQRLLCQQNSEKQYYFIDQTQLIHLPCSFCDLQVVAKTRYESAERLSKHIQFNHDQLARPVTKRKEPPKKLCSLCGKYFRGSKLKEHIKRKHDKEGLSCEYCDKLFFSAFGLKRHKEVNCKVEPCSICGETVSHGWMEKHVIFRHSPYEMRPFACQLCDKRYLEQGTLTKHVNKVHLKILPYSCHLCGKSFPIECRLVTHLNQYHSSDNEHSCVVCNYSFKSPDNLIHHIRSVHPSLASEIEKPIFHCKLCPKSFNQSQGLANHERHAHSNDATCYSNYKPYTCEACLHSFTRSDHLTRHRKRSCKAIVKKSCYKNVIKISCV